MYRINDPHFTAFIYEICGRDDDHFNRDILITPYYCSSNIIGGMVIVVSGTPAKSTIYLPIDTQKAILNFGKVKEMNLNDKYDELIAYLRKHKVDQEFNIKLP